jgi:hypothetical protein
MVPFDNLMTEARLQNIFLQNNPPSNYFIGLTWSSLRKKIINPGELRSITIKSYLAMHAVVYINLFQLFRALKLWPL